MYSFVPGFLCSLRSLWEPCMFLCVGISELENMHLLSFSEFFSDHFPKECYQFVLMSVVMRILLALFHSHNWYYLPFLFILAILTREWWDHTVALICCFTLHIRVKFLIIFYWLLSYHHFRNFCLKLLSILLLHCFFLSLFFGLFNF